MAKLDTAWAISEIEAFLYVTESIASDEPGVIGFWMRGPHTEASERAHVVEQILDRALPGWRKGRPAKDDDYDWLRDQASRGRAALQRSTELAEKLGDNAPDMGAGNLHPWAWESGRSFWNNGHYHQAVMQAAIRVNSETQAKLGRVDVSENKLFNEAFSLDEPKPGAPRLRLMDDDGSDTYKSLHRGARAFAEGLYAAIRNPGMHTPPPAGGGEEQLALEQMAAFSLLARWVDQATIKKV
ncbi:TIGR02391 family protein [Actinoplanes sp. NPDC026619]|uniref:TIGR02391 family protein n=1 Tax=Actinoplanes sp. NPDC026619 TaxID=3155798 RepID=UPI0033E8C209